MLCSTMWHGSLKAISSLKELARNQLGTVGSGNHYVDLFTDEEDRVWIGVHFGSRGLGHKTATHFLKGSGHASDGMDVEPCVLSTGSKLELSISRLCVWPVTTPMQVVTGSAAAWPRSWDRRLSKKSAQPSQLRLARRTRRRTVVGCTQRGDAGLSGPARICWRHDG